MRFDFFGVSSGRLRDKLTQLLQVRPRTREQFIRILRDAQRHDLLNADALAMVEGVLQVAEMRVRDIMIPRAHMVVVNREDPPEKFLPLIIDSAHSRFPVIGDERGEVIGLLLAKDVLEFCAEGDKRDFNLREILRPAVFVPESKRLDVLLREFRSGRNHMAIVVDEYGGVAGLVTIEDVLEQIVGEIEDEHDFEEQALIVRLRENLYMVKGLLPISEFNEQFSTDYSDEEFDTIGGLITNRFGHMPRRGEALQLDRFRFEVVRADGRRVHLLRLRTMPGVQSVAETHGSRPTPG